MNSQRERWRKRQEVVGKIGDQRAVLRRKLVRLQQVQAQFAPALRYGSTRLGHHRLWAAAGAGVGLLWSFERWRRLKRREKTQRV